MIEELYKDYYKYSDFYDIFNKYRNYNREMRFILNMAKNKKYLLDIGCGTGIHLNILKELGYIVYGIDKSQNMIDIAKDKGVPNLYNMDILDYKLDEKFDAIIAMHSVFNHLKGYDEFEKALVNSLNHLNSKGVLVIDLDNRRSNADVFDKVDGNKRYLECFYSDKYSTQIRTTTFRIGLKDFIFEHEYFIYDTKKLEEIFKKYDITYTFLTNFSRQHASKKSNRVHIVIKKD